MDDIQEKAQKIVLSYLDTTKTYKLKSGMFKIEDSLSLKEDVLPFSIEGEKFLHEATLLTLLQESGSQVIFYSDFLSKGTKDSISILNQVYQLLFYQYHVLVY
mgnify:CR=1 FL=1